MHKYVVRLPDTLLLLLSFMQGIYINMPETMFPGHISVTAIL